MKHTRCGKDDANSDKAAYQSNGLLKQDVLSLGCSLVDPLKVHGGRQRDVHSMHCFVCKDLLIAAIGLRRVCTGLFDKRLSFFKSAAANRYNDCNQKRGISDPKPTCGFADHTY